MSDILTDIDEMIRRREAHSPLAKAFGPAFLPLVDRKFSRDDALRAAGIGAYKVEEECVLEVCDGRESELEEVKRASVEWSKCELTHHLYRAREFEEDIRRRRALRAQSGGLPVDGPTAFRRKLEMLRNTDWHGYNAFFARFNRRALAAWRSEPDRFGPHEKIVSKADADGDCRQEREVVVEDGLADCFSKYGLTGCRALTRKTSLAWAVPVSDRHQLFVAVDRFLQLQRHRS